MFRTRIKICGITNLADALNAIASGADALGFNFYPESARYIRPDEAAILSSKIPAFVSRVGLFVNEAESNLAEILEIVNLDLLQFHGDESASYCEATDRPYIKALRATTPEGIATAADEFTNSRAILIDSAVDGQFGGTGQAFDWDLVPDLGKPVVIAGGLNSENVGSVIRKLHPYGVDVSGGVEKSKGQKDLAKMKAFARAVAMADGEAT